MTLPDSQDPSDSRGADAASSGTPAGKAASGTSEAETAASLPGEERRGVAEWAVVLVLVALIVGVAWSQFGPLFETSTAGSEGAAPGAAAGLEVEAEGVVVGGTAMSSLSDLAQPEPANGVDSPDEGGDTDEPDEQE